MGVLFGSIRVMEKRLRQNHLLTMADSFANQIINELELRRFDENSNSIAENGLTLVFGMEADENIADWSTLDDVDDFHLQNITDDAFPQMDANTTLSYVNLDIASGSVQVSAVPTLFKRLQVVIDHPLFDTGIRYSSIFGGGFDSELLIERATPLSITVNKEAGEHVVLTGDVLVLTVEFSENVFLDDNDDQFVLYIDIISGVLTGEEGSFSKRISNQNEIKALYSGGEGTNQLTFELSIDVGMNLAASSLDDYLSYRPRLVVENGSVIDDENNEIIYDLPGVESDNAFTSSTNILPLLQQWNTPIFTTAEQAEYDDNLSQQVTTASAQDIFDNWDRFEDNNIDTEPPYTGNFNQWTLFDNGADSYIYMNVNIHNHNLGFVSDDSVENFIYEATLFSDRSDDDVIGLVIAFYRENNKNYAIAVGKSFNGLQPMRNNGTFGVFYGEIAYIFDNSVNSTHAPLLSPGTKYNGAKNGWRSRYTRIKVQRNGDDITVKMNGEHDSRESAKNGAFIEEHTISFNLDDDPKLEKFKGIMQYGYIVRSQASSRWYDISTSTGSIERRNISILVQLGEGNQTTTTEYHKTNDDGDYLAREIALMQADIGYLRPLFNPETGNKYLITNTGIMVYPFAE